MCAASCDKLCPIVAWGTNYAPKLFFLEEASFFYGKVNLQCLYGGESCFASVTEQWHIKGGPCCRPLKTFDSEAVGHWEKRRRNFIEGLQDYLKFFFLVPKTYAFLSFLIFFFFSSKFWFSVLRAQKSGCVQSRPVSFFSFFWNMVVGRGVEYL